MGDPYRDPAEMPSTKDRKPTSKVMRITRALAAWTLLAFVALNMAGSTENGWKQAAFVVIFIMWTLFMIIYAVVVTSEVERKGD